MKGWKHKKTPTIVGNEKTPTKMESGQVIINKKATKQNLNKLIKINNDGLDTEKSKVSTDGTEGGILKGKPHYDKNGNSLGGIPVIVDGAKKIEVEGDEFVVNKEASQKHWKELSKINQSAGNGVPINPNDVGADEDPEEFRKGGKIIEFNPNHIPSSWIYNYAKKIKEKYPKVWDMGGNIFGNEAFKNLERVVKRGYWKDSEEWMYIKWQSYVARHHKDFRIAGTVAMLKWVDKTDKGWDYMKALIEKEIAKKYPKKGFKRKMQTGGMMQGEPPKNFENVLYKELANRYEYGGGVKDIICKCGWGWNKNQSEKHDEYVCHKCGRDNKMKDGGYIYKEDFYEPKKNGEIGYKFITDEGLQFDVSLTNIDKKSKKAVLDFQGDYSWETQKNKNPFKTLKTVSNIIVYSLNKLKKDGYEINTIIYDATEQKGRIYRSLIEKEIPNVTFKRNYFGSMEATFNPKELKMKYGGELAKGIKIEAEHQDTFKKVYAHKLTPMQAPVEVAKEHLKEDKNYYSKLGKMEKFNTGGAATSFEIGDIVRGEYFPGIYGNYIVKNLGADAVQVRNLLTLMLSTMAYNNLVLFRKTGSTQVTASNPAKTFNTGIEIPKSYTSSISPEAKRQKDFEVGDVIRTRYDNWPNIDDYESANNLAEVTKKTLNADGEYEYDIKGNNSKYTGRYLGKSLELAVERPGQPTMPIPNLVTDDVDIAPSYIASIVSTSWLNEYNVGDKVRIRVDFTGNSRIFDTVLKAQENTYDKPENIFTIKSFIVDKKPFAEDKKGNNTGGLVRPENPSGKLYTLSNGQSWEGKDLELVRANKNIVNAQPSQPAKKKFVSMDFKPFLENWVNSNFMNATSVTKKDIVKETIENYILDVEAVDGNQTITFNKETEILDKIDNYIN